MTAAEFVYTTYIKTTPQKLWDAITNPEFTRQYWGVELVTDWKKGSPWQSVSSDDTRRVSVTGEILEAMPPRRLVMSWSNFAEPGAPSYSRVTFEIDPIEDMVRLNVIHDDLGAGTETARRVAIGWPRVLSSMKSLLETGKALNTWAGDPGCAGTRKTEVAA